MAQYTVDYHHDSGFSPARILGYFGGILSLVLVAAIATWGARLVVRDVSDVPVVRAAAGPMRIQPENPGGQIATHEGLAVNEVAAVGVAAAVEDRVMLAPEDIVIPAEDLIISPPIGRASAPNASTSDPSQAVLTPALSPGDPPVPEPAIALSPADEVQALLMQVLAEDEPSATPQVTVIRPIARRKRAGVGFRATVIGQRSTEPQVLTSAPNGTTVVQLGAFPTQGDAKLHWQETSQRFAGLMAGKQLLLQQASSGGANFFRLRAMGFGDLAQAERFCTEFSANGAECIPVVIR